MDNARLSQSRAFWCVLIVFFSTIYPRLCFLGAFPNMDEGFYVWEAMHIGRHIQQYHMLPDDGPLALYPLLLFWLSFLKGNILVWFRLADMCVAACAAWIFCKIMLREASNSWRVLPVAFVFLCCLNLEPVINSGFKNSNFAAFIPLFAAFWLASGNIGKTSGKWYAIGMCVALAVLLRETFVPFAALGFCAIWLGWNFAAALRYAIGGIITGILIMGCICLARGGWLQLVQAYTSATAVYAVQSGMVLKKFLENGGRAVTSFSLPILLAILSYVSYRKVSGQGGNIAGSQFCSRRTFWLFAALLPILEPASKVGFLYHFSVSLPGLAGFTAYNLKYFSSLISGNYKKITAVFILLAGVGSLFMLPGPLKFYASMRNLSYIFSDAPEEKYVNASNTLIAANIIKDNLPHGGSLSTSGFTYFLYGTCNALPPDDGPFDADDVYQLSDLARSYRAMGQDSRRLGDALEMNPPDVISVACAVEEHEPDFCSGVLDGIAYSGKYDKIAFVPPDKHKNYGWLGYHIFKRKHDPK